jgi:hypothetical protein
LIPDVASASTLNHMWERGSKDGGTGDIDEQDKARGQPSRRFDEHDQPCFLAYILANEWALVLTGFVRLAAVNEDGKGFINDVCAEDVWLFPTGVPHSIVLQASGEEVESLLVFDSDFNEDGTFLALELSSDIPSRCCRRMEC